MSSPLLEIDGLQVRFPALGKESAVQALDGVSLMCGRGETLGIVGESGSGKSTLARAVVGLVRPDAGAIRFDGNELTALSGRQLLPFRRRVQMVFQDPYGSLDPRMRVEEIVGEPLAIHGVSRGQRRGRVSRLLDRVGLPPEAARRYPHAFSGGQRQRIGIARALALEPQLLIADEPVSALDVSVQAQVLNLLDSLRRELSLSCLFVSHDLRVVQRMAERVVVMYQGRIVEEAATPELYRYPLHPYTRALFSALPPFPPAATQVPPVRLAGGVERAVRGCAFAPRCPQAREQCRQNSPALRELAPGHKVACFVAEEESNSCSG